MDNRRKSHLYTIAIPCLWGLLAVMSIGCLEDYMEPTPAPECDTDSDVVCKDIEQWRCKGEVSQICRTIGACTSWRPMEDCSNIAGGVCPLEKDDPATTDVDETELSDSQPRCTGDYWVNGYCPDATGPASSSCGSVTEFGCCDQSEDGSEFDNKIGDKFLVCEDGELWCYQCGSYYYGYYYTVCGWNPTLSDPKDKTSAALGYDCWSSYEYPLDSDPNGVYPATCTK